MIKLENIQVTFAPEQVAEKTALNNLSLTIKEGEWLTIIGSNGAGKSTLLNVIAGDVLPNTGRILVDGRDVSRLPAHERAPMIARVFQDPLVGTFGDLTLAENLAIAQQRGVNRGFYAAIDQEQRDFYRELLARFRLHLKDRLEATVSSLSGGQRQALALVMATISPARVLLLDEHTSALDPKMAAFVMDLTSHLVRQKKLTVLMITHSLQQALKTGSRTLMLHEGQIIFDAIEPARASLTVDDLLHRFGGQVDDDRLLLHTQGRIVSPGQS